MSAGKFAGSGSCENSVMVWFPLWKGGRSPLNVGGEETSFWCVPGSVTWATLTRHSTATGCNNHAKKHRQELRCSKKPPTSSYLTLPPNSIPFCNTKQAVTNALGPVLVSWSIFWNVRLCVGLWGVWVGTSGCAQPQIIHKSQRNTSKETNCHPLLFPFSASSPPW